MLYPNKRMGALKRPQPGKPCAAKLVPPTAGTIDSIIESIMNSQGGDRNTLTDTVTRHALWQCMIASLQSQSQSVSVMSLAQPARPRKRVRNSGKDYSKPEDSEMRDISMSIQRGFSSNRPIFHVLKAQEIERAQGIMQIAEDSMATYSLLNPVKVSDMRPRLPSHCSSPRDIKSTLSVLSPSKKCGDKKAHLRAIYAAITAKRLRIRFIATRDSSLTLDTTSVPKREDGGRTQNPTKSKPTVCSWAPGQVTTGRNRCRKMRKDQLNKVIPVHEIGSLSSELIEDHIRRLRLEMKVYRLRRLGALLQKLMEHQKNYKGLFNHPVDYVGLNLPTYTSVVKNPMDLGTVKAKLEKGEYDDAKAIDADVILVFNNALLFNPVGHYVHESAKQLKAYYLDAFSVVKAKIESEIQDMNNHNCATCFGQTCSLCGHKCLEFSMPQLHCSGGCGVNVRRGSTYFITSDGTRLWCVKCYNKTGRGKRRKNAAPLETTGIPLVRDATCLPDAVVRKATATPPSLEQGDTHSVNQDTASANVDTLLISSQSIQQFSQSSLLSSVDVCTPCSDSAVELNMTRQQIRRYPEPKLRDVKGELNKKRCEVESEPWVRCSQCEKWMHQICAIFNPIAARINGMDKEFECPKCVVKRRKEEKGVEQAPVLQPRIPRAQDIKQTPMGSSIESFLREELNKAGDGEFADTIHVRVVSSLEKTQHISPAMRRVFQFNPDITVPDTANGYPASIPYVSQAILVFQTQHGVDMTLFSMYVQEYDDMCPLLSNRRRVYIAYLDSVRYLEPARIRTTVYHHVLLGYLASARDRGFETAHIWSCPPQRSVSYVFWCHPPYQRTPSTDHLRDWYKRMLSLAKQKGIVRSWTTFYDRFFAPADPIGGDAYVTAKKAPVASSTRKQTTQMDPAVAAVWPIDVLPPCFDGDYWPAEADRLIQRKISSNIAKKSKHKLRGGSTPGGSVSSSESIDEESIPLRHVFDAALPSIRAVKQDLLVVDLLVDSSIVGVAQKRPEEIELLRGAFRSVSSRQAFHQLCAFDNYQFDSYRRTRHSTLMVLHHLFNSHLPEEHVFCDYCGLLIIRQDESVIEDERCDWCRKNEMLEEATKKSTVAA